jgi:hypothetical protein
VPLVLFPDGCVYRQQIIRALTDIDAKPSAAEPHLTSANGVTARRFASKAAFAAAFCSCRRLGVHTTLRWRKPDSNSRSHFRAAPAPNRTGRRNAQEARR